MSKDYRSFIMEEAVKYLNEDGVNSKIVLEEEVERFTKLYDSNQFAYFDVYKTDDIRKARTQARRLAFRVLDYAVRYSTKLNVVEGALFYISSEDGVNYLRVVLLQDEIPWNNLTPTIYNGYTDMLGLKTEEEEWNQWLKQ